MSNTDLYIHVYLTMVDAIYSGNGVYEIDMHIQMIECDVKY